MRKDLKAEWRKKMNSVKKGFELETALPILKDHRCVVNLKSDDNSNVG